MHRLIFTLLGVVLLFSCGSDDPKPPVIVGTWNALTFDSKLIVAGGHTLEEHLIIDYRYSHTMAKEIATNVENALVTRGNLGGSLIIKDDGTYSRVLADTTYTGKWKLLTNDTYFQLDPTGGTLHLETAQVLTLNETDLELNFDVSEEVGLPNDPVVSCWVTEKYKRSN